MAIDPRAQNVRSQQKRNATVSAWLLSPAFFFISVIRPLTNPWQSQTPVENFLFFFYPKIDSKTSFRITKTLKVFFFCIKKLVVYALSTNKKEIQPCKLNAPKGRKPAFFASFFFPAVAVGYIMETTSIFFFIVWLIHDSQLESIQLLFWHEIEAVNITLLITITWTINTVKIPYGSLYLYIANSRTNSSSKQKYPWKAFIKQGGVWNFSLRKVKSFICSINSSTASISSNYLPLLLFYVYYISVTVAWYVRAPLWAT